MKVSNTVRYHESGTGSELVLDFYNSETSSRHQVEDFIHHVFKRAYKADLHNYLPDLMALRNKSNRLVAALGMRKADSGKLFLENYLNAPVEDAVSQLHGSRVTRDKIMEVGNLASVHRGGLRQLIVALTSYLSGVGSEWVVFTAVPAVRDAFAAMDLNLHPLAKADKACLDEQEQAAWGTYYESGPVVVAGRVEEGYLRLREILDPENAMNFQAALWQYAFVAGTRQRNIAAEAIATGSKTLIQEKVA
jgi:hypothetical protein